MLLALAFPGYWAYQRWLASDVPEAVSQSAQDRADVLAVADDYAATLFAEEKWEEAAKAYRLLRDRYLQANGGVYDDAAAVLMFNEAASELNRGSTRAGRLLLLELAREAPSYQPETIAQLLEETALTPEQEIDELTAAASAAFDRAHWAEAIRLFGRVLVALEAAGRTASDDRVSQTQYDQAMAYWNAEQHARAEELLRAIRAGNPDYEPDRIREEHERVLAILEKRSGS